MNSWEIIKTELAQNSRKGTMGRHIELNKCADLFLRLLPNLMDHEAAKEALNKDDECRDALLNRGQIEELRKSGVI